MPLHPVDTAGEAMFSGCIATLSVARDVIASMLPPAVMPAPDSPGDEVLLAFGEQANGMTYFGGVPIPWGVRYHELMVAIPFVHRRGDDAAYLFVSGMTCDFLPAVWNGNQYYGFRKRYVAMSSRPDGFVVDPADSGFAGSLRPTSAPGQHREWLLWPSSLPILAVREDGSFVRTRFDWSFENRQLETAETRVRIGRHFPELPSGTYEGAGVRVTGMRWRLGWPQGC